MVLRRSLKQTGMTVKGSPVFSQRLYHRWPSPSMLNGAYPFILLARRCQFQWVVDMHPRATGSLALTVRIAASIGVMMRRQRSPETSSVSLTAFSTSARRPLRTDRCQPQKVRNLLTDHVL